MSVKRGHQISRKSRFKLEFNQNLCTALNSNTVPPPKNHQEKSPSKEHQKDVFALQDKNQSPELAARNHNCNFQP